MTAKRNKSGRFQKGKSGNPGGRPKLAEEFKARARQAVDEHVLQAWIDELEVTERPIKVGNREIVVSKRGDNWVKCSELLAAYGYGKPAQPVTGADGDGPVQVEGIVVEFVKPKKG